MFGHFGGSNTFFTVTGKNFPQLALLADPLHMGGPLRFLPAGLATIQPPVGVYTEPLSTDLHPPLWAQNISEGVPNDFLSEDGRF